MVIIKIAYTFKLFPVFKNTFLKKVKNFGFQAVPNYEYRYAVQVPTS
jgi:hypothetical protein